jgi:hypothetical protein
MLDFGCCMCVLRGVMTTKLSLSLGIEYALHITAQMHQLLALCRMEMMPMLDVLVVAAPTRCFVCGLPANLRTTHTALCLLSLPSPGALVRAILPQPLSQQPATPAAAAAPVPR